MARKTKPTAIAIGTPPETPPASPDQRPAALGDRVRVAREALGLVQEDAAARIGMARSTYGDVERYSTLPYALLMRLFAAGYDPAILCPELTEVIREWAMTTADLSATPGRSPEI